MAISRADLLKELLPGLEALFGVEYDKYESEKHEIEVDLTPLSEPKEEPK